MVKKVSQPPSKYKQFKHLFFPFLQFLLSNNQSSKVDLDMKTVLISPAPNLITLRSFSHRGKEYISVTAMEIVEEGQNQPKIPQKRIKFQEIVENGEEDRISAFPDCLLVEILSRLPSTKDAIITGTLSRRWKHLWTMVSTLIFHYDDNHSWPNFVNKTLTKIRQPKLKKFELHTTFVTQFESQVNNWICYAINRDVEELNLRLRNMESEDEIPLHQHCFIGSCFTHLTLEGFKLDPTGTITWKNLRRLSIFNAKLDEDLIGNILSGSPVLETLVLERCHGYRLLHITSKSVKNLVISGYLDPEDEHGDLPDILEINALNIISLTIRGQLVLWNILLLNVSSLMEAELDYTFMGVWETLRKEEMLKGFILNLGHVKKLKIGVCCFKALSRLEAKGFIFPSNLEFPVII